MSRAAASTTSTNHGNDDNGGNPSGRSRGGGGAAVPPPAVSKERHIATLAKRATEYEQCLAAAAKDKTLGLAAAAAAIGGGGGAPANAAAASHNNTSNSNNSSINWYRVKLCEVLSDWLLTDPESAHATDAVGRLWRSCFYARVGPARARLSRDKKKKNNSQQNLGGHPSAAAAAAAVAASAKQEESLLVFLAEGVTLYDYLCDKLQDRLVRGGDGDGGGDGGMDGHTNATTAGIVPCLHRLYIHLGDLHRYGHRYGPAERAYATAAHLGPSSGHAYNQLAVVCQVKDDDSSSSNHKSAAAAVTVYWYARSLAACHEPFPTAAANLNRLFASNREWLQQHHQKHVNDTDKAGTANPPPVVLAGTASRLFLSQFVDLQSALFAADAAAVTDQFSNRLGDAAASFRELLRSSAFGDSLLCKLAAIMAFAEFHCRLPPPRVDRERTTTTTANAPAAARTVTLELGQCLAQRVAWTLRHKIKPGQPSVPSVRVLMPLLLLTEYLLHDDTDTTSFAAANDRYSEALQSFWKSVVDIFNLLQPLPIPMDDDLKQLKEYQELRGFAPFEPFLKDGGVLSETGYLSDAAAAELFAVHTNTGSSTQESSLRSSQVTNLSSTEDAAHVKWRRFLGLRSKLLEAALPGLCFRESSVDKILECEADIFNADVTMDFADTDEEDDVHIGGGTINHEGVVMDDNNVDDGKDGGELLVYKQIHVDSPALLVPGAFLLNRLPESPPKQVNAATTSALLQASVASANLPVPFDHQHDPVVAPKMPPAPPPFHPIRTDPLNPVGARLVGYAVLPPPGFGQHYSTASTPPPPLGGGLHSGRSDASDAPHALDFFQNFVSAESAADRGPTIGESYHLFGGPSALQTANPFAANSMPSFGLGSFAVPPRDDAFLTSHQVAIGFDGTTLLDSSLLSSLLMDDSPRQAATKNPFAT